jgi:hypothetical protein
MYICMYTLSSRGFATATAAAVAAVELLLLLLLLCCYAAGRKRGGPPGSNGSSSVTRSLKSYKRSDSSVPPSVRILLKTCSFSPARRVRIGTTRNRKPS